MTTAKDDTEVSRALNEADMMSQGACSTIQMIAQLALHALENPGADMETIAEALTEIKYAASSLKNDINVIAERFGCNFIDEFERARADRRRDAYAAKARSFVAAGASHAS